MSKGESGKTVRPRLLKLLIFPWGIWSVFAEGGRRARRRYSRHSLVGSSLIWVVQVFAYLLFGLPVTVLLLGEVLITLNELVIAEQANYRLQSDWSTPEETTEFVVPGIPIVDLDPPIDHTGEVFYQYLVELYAPVVYQKMSHHPEWDIPVALDFDGNEDPRDNVRNEKAFRPHVATVYGELTAETLDSYYLTYSFYHIKDYDHPVRETLSRWTYHDNDNEGYHIRVDKQSMQVAEVETWFHNRFLLYNRTGVSEGTEPVHGKMHFEGNTHLIVYVQPQGHGVRLAQLLDLPHLDRNVKILRPRLGSDVVRIRANRTLQTNGTYELRNFDAWYAQAQGPLGSEGEGTGIFEEEIPLGVDQEGTPRVVGRFIAGYDYDVNGWSRPKPMWSWDDGWDSIPIFVWHFLPSYSFASHGGSHLSHEYLYNRPCSKTFGQDAAVVFEWLDLELVLRGGEKWSFQGRGDELSRDTYWVAMQHLAKRYVNYIFHALG